MLMDVGLDTGDILEQNEIEIADKETSDSLFGKLSYLTADTIYHTVINFDNIKSIKQDESHATKSVIIKKEYGIIDFSKEKKIEVDRKIRAYTSWPSAYLEDGDIKYKIWDVDIIDGDINLSNAKKFLKDVYIVNDSMYAKCIDGFLRINELQKSGKNRMKAKDFINGLMH